jgi:hypothetical protein
MPLPPWLKHLVTNMFMSEEAAFCYMFCEKCGLTRPHGQQLDPLYHGAEELSSQKTLCQRQPVVMGELHQPGLSPPTLLARQRPVPIRWGFFRKSIEGFSVAATSRATTPGTWLFRPYEGK